MSKLLRRLLSNSALWRDAMQWRVHRQVVATVIRPALALELATYTKAQCLLAVDNMKLPPTAMGEVAAILHARCGRGNTTLEDAVQVMAHAIMRDHEKIFGGK